MADLLLGELVDPAAHQRNGTPAAVSPRRPDDARRDRRHDRLGQDRSRRRAHRGGAVRRRARAAHRPQGRPDQPVPHLPRPRAGRLPAVGQRGRRAEGRRDPGRVRRAAGDDVDGRPRRLGHHARADRRAARRGRLHRSTRPGSTAGVPLNIVGSLQAPADTSDLEVVRRRDRRLRVAACSDWSASTPIRCRRASTSCSATSSRTRGRRAHTRPRARWSARCSSRRCASSACSSSTSSSRRTTARRSRCGSTVCSPRRRSRRGRAAPRSTSTRCCARPTAPARDRHDRAPRRRGAPVRHRARAVASSSRGCAGRAARPTCARSLHGRGRRLPAAHGEPADEEADHDAAQAGAGVRRRRRALDAEPGRRRLQGALQRRHLDGRPAADRAGQGPAARRHERGRRRRRRDGASATPSADSASASSCCAGPARTRPEVLTTRWAMSYLRGPLTRDQIAHADVGPTAATASTAAAAPTRRAPAERCATPACRHCGCPRGRICSAAPAGDDATPVMPEVAPGYRGRPTSIPRRRGWRGRRRPGRRHLRCRGRRPRRLPLRRREGRPGRRTRSTRPCSSRSRRRPTRRAAVAVDYDDRDLLAAAPRPPRPFVLPEAPTSPSRSGPGWRRTSSPSSSGRGRWRSSSTATLKLYARSRRDARRVRRPLPGGRRGAKADEDSRQAARQVRGEGPRPCSDQLQAPRRTGPTCWPTAGQGQAARGAAVDGGSIIGGFLSGRWRSNDVRRAAGRALADPRPRASASTPRRTRSPA